MGIDYTVSKDVFINHLKGCILAWNEEEMSRIGQVLLTTENTIRKLKITLQNALEDILGSIIVKFLYVKDKINESTTQENIGNILIVDISDIKGFYEKVGSNTPSIIGPDEILAEIFALFALNKINVPSMDVLDRIGEVIHSCT